MTTTTMDLRGVSASRADRKTSPGGYRYPTGPNPHVALVAVDLAETRRGRPPPAYLERLVARTAWAFCAIAVAWVFGADLARWLWSLV